MIPVNGFYHILAINDYMNIVNEQFNIIIESGLYHKCKTIYIGCIGEKKEYLNLLNYFADYHKVKIESYSDNNSEFEFLTLKILKKVSDKDNFYGFYIHTKGVSYQKNIGGKYWRDYMNYYNLACWRDAIGHLKLGYDTYGVKLLSARMEPAKKLHYSGNFYWFRSDYAKTLKPVESFDLKNRFDAEVYICSNHPIAATACQDFVDYTQKGTFKPLEKNEQ
jgi:hypothetical protein